MQVIQSEGKQKMNKIHSRSVIKITIVGGLFLFACILGSHVYGAPSPSPTPTPTPSPSPTSSPPPTPTPSPVPTRQVTRSDTLGPTATSSASIAVIGTPTSAPFSQPPTCLNEQAQIIDLPMDATVDFRDTLVVRGTANIPNFKFYKVQYRPDNEAGWGGTLREVSASSK